MESKWRCPKTLKCAFCSVIFLVSIVVLMHATAMAQSIGSAEQLATQLEEVIAAQEIGDAAARDKLAQINNNLRAQGLNIAIEAIQFFTIGQGRPDIRMHQEGVRWVPEDGRRFAQGNSLTYCNLFSLDPYPSDLPFPGLDYLPPPPGLSIAQAQSAIDAAMSTWANDHSLKKLTIQKLTETGSGGVFGVGDIMNVGWSTNPNLSSNILAITAIGIFVDTTTAIPTDINGDHYIDTAGAIIWYNGALPWVGIDAFDLQTVALHEAGHAIGIGHFGPLPIAVMNPVYGGIKQTLFPIDSAGMSTLFGSWPNP